MKKNMYNKFLGLLLCVGLFSACQSEDDILTNKYSISFATDTEAPNTRASVDESAIVDLEALRIRWDEGDKVTMWCGTQADDVRPCTFNLIEESISKADFIYEGDSVATQYYYGFYPELPADSNPHIQFSVPTNGEITQTAPSNSRHLRDYRAMYAPVVEREENSNILTDVKFKQLTSLCIFEIANHALTDMMIRSISLKTKDGSPIFYDQAEFEAGVDTDFRLPESPSSSSTMLSFDNMQIKAGEEKVTAYLPLLPSASLEGKTIVLEVKLSDGTTLSREFPNLATAIGSFQAQTYYIFTVERSEDGLSIDISMEGWTDGGGVIVPVE